MKSFKHYILVIAISVCRFEHICYPIGSARMIARFTTPHGPTIGSVEGQILPRWAGELNYGYGMPLFNLSIMCRIWLLR